MACPLPPGPKSPSFIYLPDHCPDHPIPFQVRNASKKWPAPQKGQQAVTLKKPSCLRLRETAAFSTNSSASSATRLSFPGTIGVGELDTLTEAARIPRIRGFVPPGSPGFTFSETVKPTQL
jgi:hypothetical protein